jgi:hypothetical protein
MYNIIKKIVVSSAMLGMTAVSFAQVPEIGVQVGGGVVPAATLPSVGNLNFSFSFTTSNPATSLNPGEVNLALNLPFQIQISENMVVYKIVSGVYVLVNDWQIELDEFPNSANITLVGTITAPGAPAGNYFFSIPYTCVAPIPNPPSHMAFNWTLDAYVVGQNRNLQILPTSITSRNGIVTATNESLPITFNYFTATNTNCEANLNWSIEKEEGFETYVVERSKNGLAFEEVGSVKYDAASLGKYEFVDKEPIVGANFYRVKASQPDGHSYLSPIKRTTVDCDLVNINVFPNPTDGQITVSGLNPGYIVRMYDLTGRMITNTVAKRNDLSVDLLQTVACCSTLKLLKNKL